VTRLPSIYVVRLLSNLGVAEERKRREKKKERKKRERKRKKDERKRRKKEKERKKREKEKERKKERGKKKRRKKRKRTDGMRLSAANCCILLSKVILFI
jgi:Flp pilus assembly protein TadB